MSWVAVQIVLQNHHSSHHINNLLTFVAEELRNRFPACKVVLWDERLSTVAAEKVLVDADMRRNKRKKIIDMMAAVVILQNYLDSTPAH